MKKNLFLAAIAVVGSMLFSACDPVNVGKKTDVESIAILPSSVTIAHKSTQQLTVKVTPDNAKEGLEITWSSSDEEIATVNDNGYVTASDKDGIAIITATAKQGSETFTATCEVTVADYYVTLSFNEAVLWNIDEITDSTVYTITSSSGEQYKCYLADAMLRILSEGLNVSNTTYKLDGADEGVIIDLHAPMYYAEKTLNNKEQNTIFSLGYWAVRDIDTIAANIGHKGKINEAVYASYAEPLVNAWNAYVAEQSQDNRTAFLDMFDKAGEEAIQGTYFYYWYYDCRDQTDINTCTYYPDVYTMNVPTGLVENMTIYISGDKKATNELMYGIDALELQMRKLDGWFGFDTESNQDYTRTLNSTNILYSDPLIYQAGQFPQRDEDGEDEEAAYYEMQIFSERYPEAAKAIDEQIRNSDRFVLISNK